MRAVRGNPVEPVNPANGADTVVGHRNGRAPVALQRCDTFVGTMNWLYDHLRCVPRHTPLIMCDRLSRRDQFPELEVWLLDRRISRRIWRRVVRGHLYPPDRRILSRRAPTVLHSHFGYVALGDLPLQRSLEIPWIVGFYGADVYRFGWQPRWQERYANVFRNCALALALGPRMADGLAATGCPPEKIRVHPLGVDVQTIPHAPREFKPGDTLRVLFAGAFVNTKGLPDVVRAVGLARDAGLRLELDIAGDRALGRPDQWGLKDEVFGLIARLGLEDCVRHHSWLGFNDLLALALKCHVFVAPSVTASDGDAEGTPFVLQQMMATAMPVISTLHSDIPYILGEHASLLLPEHDVRGIADRLQRYHDLPETMITEGLALRDRIGNAFDVRACAARLSDLYDEVSSV